MPRRREPKPAMPPRIHLGKRERRLAEEVLHLHSLWRRGPPAPAPKQFRSAHRETTDHKRRRLDGTAAEPKDTGAGCAIAPPPPNSSPKTWPEAAPASTTTSPAKKPPPPPPPPSTSPGALAEREALRAAAEYFSHSKRGGPMSEGEQDAAGFLTGLFARDAALRGHYERCWEGGEFECLACAAGGRKVGRRFRGCVSLVQHARAASTRNGWPRAHRALARVLGRVLGWNIWKVPTIVIDPRGTLGQALAAGDVQLEKENDDTGEDTDSSSDEDDEEYGTGEDDDSSSDEDEEEHGTEEVTDSSSDEDEEEDVETGMEDSSTDGDEEDSELESSEESAEKDVEKGTEDSEKPDDDDDDDEGAIQLDNSEKSALKEEMEEIGPLNCEEISKNEVLSNESIHEVNTSKDDSLNKGNNAEVRNQEIAKNLLNRTKILVRIKRSMVSLQVEFLKRPER